MNNNHEEMLPQTEDFVYEQETPSQTEDFVYEQETPSQTEDSAYEQETPSQTEDFVYEQETPSQTEDSAYEQETPSQTEDFVDNSGISDSDRRELTATKANDRTGFAGLLLSMIIVPVSVIYMEIISKLQIFGDVFDDKFIYMFLQAAATGLFLGAFPMLLSGKNRRRLLRLILGILSVLFSVHVVYYNNFHNFYSWNNIGEAGGATHFWREALLTIVSVWYMMAALFVPLLVMCFAGKKLIPGNSKRSIPFAAAAMVGFMGLYLPSVGLINSYKGQKGENNPYYHYTFIQNDLDQTFHYYGILNSTRLDLKQLIFGAPVETIDMDGLMDFSGGVSGSDYSSNGDSVVEYGFNVMDIDFDSLHKIPKYEQLDQFFQSVTPTRKNKYTDYFKGKNLIFLTLESFCPQVIDSEFTPLLYKMSTEGFVFNHFYNPMWGGSTSSGEYAIITGNFNPYTNCLNRSAETYQPFALGNQFNKLGYTTLAYHNYTGYFYNREKSHPNFGYTFKGSDCGLKLATNTWPNSDKEMADASINEYCNLNGRFHVYYMTMSGHMKYNFKSNNMSSRHLDDLPEKYKDLNAEVKAYFACQYEVELMLQVLVDKLEESGKLKDTVFAMSADHYPYAMSNRGLSKLYGYEKEDFSIRNDIELYRNSFILWNSEMTEPVTVNAPCSTVDILPTLSNMFGLEYDSRLMMGSDIMSPGDHVAMIKMDGWSWVSTQGTYLASLEKFIPNESCTLSEDEIEE